MEGSFLRQLGRFGSVPTHMLWKSNALYMALADGTLASIRREEIFPKTSQEKNTAKEINSVSANSTRILKKSTHVTTDSDDDVDFEEDTRPSKKPNKSFVMDEAEEDDADHDDDDGSLKNEPKEDPTSLLDNDDDDMPGADDEDDLEDFLEDDPHAPRTNFARIDLPEPQPAFAPSSTPLDLPRRIMCWNHVGTCTLIRTDDGTMNNTVNIDFTDSAFRRPVSFTDNMHFILGSLGEDGGIFATDLTNDEDNIDDVGELVDGLKMSERTKAAVRRSHNKRMTKENDSGKSNGSSIYFHRFETFGSLRDKDWYLTLPDGERALGCATGEGWAAVATSRRFLRLFTSGGNQGPVLWLKGDPVAVVGRSRFLAVIYHETMPLPDGTQKLGFTLFDALAGRVVTSGSLSCISSRSSLSWAGFSNDCSLLVMDSDGMLSMLVGMECPDVDKTAPGNVTTYSWDWSPVLDTIGFRKSVDDTFWPVTSQDGKLVCVPLRGGNDHPDASRRPVTTTLSFRMPFARGGLENSLVLEEASVRATLALTQKKFLTDISASDGLYTQDMEAEYDQLCANVDKVTLKLFHATVTAGKLERALDLCERLHLEKSFDIATRVADMANHRKLADRIDEVKERKFPTAELETFEERDLQSEFGRQVMAMDDETGSQRISPESGRVANSKRTLDDFSDVEDEEPRENESSEPATKKRRKPNPFAKKRLESPGKKKNAFASPGRSPSKSSTLSRLSSFSAQSRQMRSPKNLM